MGHCERSEAVPSEINDTVEAEGMGRINYLDFELKISAAGEQYRAVVLHSPGGEGRVDFSLPFSAEGLEILLLRMTRLRRASRRVDSLELAAARQLGEGLFRAVFQGTVRDCLYSSLERALGQDQTGLRLKLRLQDAPSLADLPWEFLFDPDGKRFLAQSVQTPVVRYLELRERIAPLRAALPLRILGMVSSPSDYAELNVEDEQARLEKALKTLIEKGQVQVTWLAKATLGELRRALRAEQYHVFHFIGHGGFDRQTEQGVLTLVDESGRGWLADAERLGVLLHDHRSLRLAVLNACEGARSTPADPFASVAGSLVRQGIPAVIAMQFEISDRAACAFAEEFYAALAQGYAVDAALAEARKAIYCLPEDVEWGTPVLYMRSPDGVLFEVTDRLPALEVIGAQPVRQPEPAVPEKAKPAPVEEAAQAKPTMEKPAPSVVRPKVQDPLAELATFVHIPERKFWIGKYPVTNAQYRRFLEAPDFAERELWVGFLKFGEPPEHRDLGDWGEEGWKWLQANLSKDKVVYPRYWQDETFGIAQEKAPVVGITWYEANAYCKWLLKHWAELVEGRQNRGLKPALVRLPMEAEWVCAAGGDQPSGRYPWDGPGKATKDAQEIVQRANVDASKVGHTTAVDAYPQGASQPYGLFDLAGNVWEWQANYRDKDHDVLALRGGSWLDHRGDARVAVRINDPPDYHWSDGGFRVVALPR